MRYILIRKTLDLWISAESVSQNFDSKNEQVTGDRIALPAASTYREALRCVPTVINKSFEIKQENLYPLNHIITEVKELEAFQYVREGYRIICLLEIN